MNTSAAKTAPFRKSASKQSVTALYDAFLSLKTREECAAFLRDLCTTQEINDMAERFTIARLLSKDVTYRAAADETGASTTTVTRVGHWLHHGRRLPSHHFSDQ